MNENEALKCENIAQITEKACWLTKTNRLKKNAREFHKSYKSQHIVNLR